MKEVCTYAKYETIGAIFVPGLLILWATGTVTNRAYNVKFRVNPHFSDYPHFDLLQCRNEIITGQYEPQTYRIRGLFAAGNEMNEDHVKVVAADGIVSVPVYQFKAEPAPVDPAKADQSQNPAIMGVPGIFGVPGLFGVPGMFGVPGIFRLPLDLSKVFETGNSEDMRIMKEGFDKVEAAGYSPNLSLEEALRDALNNLPPGTDSQSELTNINVDSISIERGGFTGMDALTVKISYLSLSK